MSEHLPKSHESHPTSHEATVSHEHVPSPEKTTEAYETQKQDLIEQAQDVIKHEAVSNKDLPIEERKPDVPNQAFARDEIKALAYQRIMTRTQKHLSAPARRFSKVIHQPVVDNVSRVSEKTIARPSGLLTGGLFALLGSSIMLFMAKHYGFRYNLFVFLVLFVIGFGLGLLIEFSLSATRKFRNNAH